MLHGPTTQSGQRSAITFWRVREAAMESIEVLPGQTTALMPAVVRILSRFDREQLVGFLTVAIDLLDLADALHDPDAPDFAARSDGLPGEPDDHEASGDERDCAWPEWRPRRGRIPNSPELPGYAIGAYEDAEEDDAAGQYDEDCFTGPRPRGRWFGPGCTISDPDTGDADTGAF